MIGGVAVETKGTRHTRTLVIQGIEAQVGFDSGRDQYFKVYQVGLSTNSDGICVRPTAQMSASQLTLYSLTIVPQTYS